MGDSARQRHSLVVSLSEGTFPYYSSQKERGGGKSQEKEARARQARKKKGGPGHTARVVSRIIGITYGKKSRKVRPRRKNSKTYGDF